jgi:hypothetical protein
VVDTLSATTDGAVVSFKNVNVGDTFRIYSGQNVLAEGPSPVSITGLESGIVVGAGALETTRVASGGESDRVALPAFQTRNEIPTNVSGALNEDGSVSGAWDAVKNAKAYLVHYGDANVSDPSQAIYMGYTETTSWTLAAGDVPTLAEGDTLQLFIQAFPVVGEGANDIEKAKFLNENKFGSEWSEPIILTKPLPKTPLAITINGEEQTGAFEVKETSQDEYVTLAEKDPAVVYAVQPDDPESGLVYFLGDVPVDLVKSAEGMLYNRNLLPGTTSEWKDFTISSWTTEPYRVKSLSDIGLVAVDDIISQSVELDNNNPDNQGGVRSIDWHNMMRVGP